MDPKAFPYFTGSSGIPWYSVEARRKIRGAIWSSRLNIPYGPRPNQDDNILNMGALHNYDAATRKRMIHHYLVEEGYTHFDIGPPVDLGYHDQYPTVDFRTNPDFYASVNEEAIRAGGIPILFLKPDNWTPDQLKSLEYIYKQPRWQKIGQIVVPNGWEPGEDTPNAEYVENLRWAREVFPNALIALHMVTEFDCPGNNDDLTPGQPKYLGSAECWARVCKYLHFYFIQNGPYPAGPSEMQDTATNFANQFRPISGSLFDRFNHGYAGWPTFSAYGNKPIDLINFECSAYESYWKNMPEVKSKAWGNLALSSGAVGACDGVTMR